MSQLGIGSAIVVVICCSAYIWSCWSGVKPAICPAEFIQSPQSNIGMLMIPSFIHLSLLHILFNMLAFTSSSIPLEHGLGTAPFLGLIIQLSLVSNILYIVLAYFISAAWPASAALQLCAAGFSGVIFGLMMVEIRFRPDSDSRMQLGPFSINKWLYPWLMLISIQILMPNVSFLGHLTGILSGLLYSFGFMNWFTVRRSWIRRIETRIANVVQLRSYILCPEKSLLPDPIVDLSSIGKRMRKCIRMCRNRKASSQGYRLNDEIVVTSTTPEQLV